MKKLWLTFAVSLFVSGCQINSVEGEYRDMEVKVSNKESDSNSVFCPPGQAKKGRC
jgi:hypothetical protein